METLKLSGTTRLADKHTARELRQANKIPAQLYGHETKNLNLSLDSSDFAEVYESAGSSTLVELDVDGKDKHPVLIHEVDFDPLTDEVTHIDFLQVDMKEEIEAEVELNFVGTSQAVKEEGGVLVKTFDTIEVRALPVDLPAEINVDISKLNTFDDAIKVKDLDISDKVEILREPERVIATVSPPRSEEELEALDEEVEEDVDAIEGVKEEEGEAAEGEEGAEGETNPEGEEKLAAEDPAEGDKPETKE